jgi:hypothetical protein
MAIGATSGTKPRARMALIAQNKLVINKPKKAIHNIRLLVDVELVATLLVNVLSIGLFDKSFSY